MESVSLVVTDLDGTLWHTDDHVPRGVVDALALLLAQGPPVLVATGRRITSTRVPLARLGVAPPAVVLNGAIGLDLSTGERFHTAAFPADEAVAVLDAFARRGLEPCVYVDEDGPAGAGVEVYVGERPSTNPGHLEALGATARAADLEAVVRTATVLAFSIIGRPHGDLAPVAAAVDGTSNAHLDRALDFPGTAALTVAPAGLSKWDGVRAFCAARRLDPAAVVAVGDGPNDVELLERAALAVVPDNAHPAARELADVVVPPAREGGWAQLLDLLP